MHSCTPNPPDPKPASNRVAPPDGRRESAKTSKSQRVNSRARRLRETYWLWCIPWGVSGRPKKLGQCSPGIRRIWGVLCWGDDPRKDEAFFARFLADFDGFWRLQLQLTTAALCLLGSARSKKRSWGSSKTKAGHDAFRLISGFRMVLILVECQVHTIFDDFQNHFLNIIGTWQKKTVPADPLKHCVFDQYVAIHYWVRCV